MQINDILSKMNINISTNNTAQMQNVEGVKNVAAEPQGTPSAASGTSGELEIGKSIRTSGKRRPDG